MKGISVGIAFALAASAFAAHAQTIEEKAQICAACHGDNGMPQQQAFPMPVIWGQQLGYLFFQLRDFKSGARKNEQMSPIAEALEHDDLMALAQYFSKKPWPNLQQPHAPADDGGTGAACQRLGRLHQLPSGGIQRRQHPAAPRRTEPRLSAEDHDRFPHRRARQQSRHDRFHEGDLGTGYRGARGLARGDVKSSFARAAGTENYFAASRSRTSALGRQIERGLALFVLERAVGAALQQKIDDAGVAELGGDHQRGAAAIVGVVEAGTVRDEEIDDAGDRRGADAFVVAGGPHQRGKIIAVTRPRIDPGIEEPLHDIVEAARRRIDHRRLAGCVAHVRVGAARQQRFDDAVVALECRGDRAA